MDRMPEPVTEDTVLEPVQTEFLQADEPVSFAKEDRTEIANEEVKIHEHIQNAQEQPVKKYVFPPIRLLKKGAVSYTHLTLPTTSRV